MCLAEEVSKYFTQLTNSSLPEDSVYKEDGWTKDPLMLIRALFPQVAKIDYEARTVTKIIVQLANFRGQWLNSEDNGRKVVGAYLDGEQGSEVVEIEIKRDTSVALSEHTEA